MDKVRDAFQGHEPSDLRRTLRRRRASMITVMVREGGVEP